MDAKIAIPDTGRGTAGVVVDDVTEVLMVGDDEIDNLPGGSHDCLDTIAKVGDPLVVLLEPEQIRQDLEFAA